MGTCQSSSGPTGAAVLPMEVMDMGNNEIPVSGRMPPPGAQVAPAPPSAADEDVYNVYDDGHSVTTSGLYFCEHKPSFDNLVAEAKKGNKEIVKDLLKNGADVNMKGMWGNTPLIAACQYGHGEICDLLLSCDNVDVHIKNEKGAPAILYASLEGLADVCQKILALGGDAAVDYAVIYNSQTDKSGPYTPMSAAVVNGHAEIVQILLKTGIDIDSEIVDPQQKIGSSSELVVTKPVMLACAYNRADVIKLMVGLGADVCSQDTSKGYTVLHHACKTKAAANNIVPLLLALVSINSGLQNRNEIVDVQSKNGDSALMLACDVASEAAVALLLDSGASTSLQNNMGLCALHSAVRRRAEGIVRLLTTSGADPCQEDGNGVSSLELVQKLRDDSNIKILVISAANKMAENSRLSLNKAIVGIKEREDIEISAQRGVASVFEEGVGTLPLVPSMATFITRDMLTGSLSRVDMSDNAEIAEAPSREPSCTIEGGIKLNVSPLMEPNGTPQKSDSLREVTGVQSAINTPVAKQFADQLLIEQHNSQSTGAPMKIMSSQSQQKPSSDKTPFGDVIKLAHADLFRD